MINEHKGFIGYEYKELLVKTEYATIYQDGYENFGWKFENSVSGYPSTNHVKIKFKRDRMIANKPEITKLQRQFDNIVEQIENLENSKVLMAAVFAFAVGLIATAFMALSVFSITFWSNYGSMVLFAIPGLIGWIAPYFIYIKMRNRKTKKVAPIVDEKYDELYQVMKQANALL